MRARILDSERRGWLLDPNALHSQLAHGGTCISALARAGDGALEDVDCSARGQGASDVDGFGGEVLGVREGGEGEDGDAKTKGSYGGMSILLRVRCTIIWPVYRGSIQQGVK